jgi:exonuclease III
MYNIMGLTRFLGLFLFYFLSFSDTILADTECPTVTSISDRRKDKNSLRLVQYNVEWLFIDYYSGMDCPGNGCTWHSVSDAQTHLSYVANTVKTLQPDIINLCEVEGCDELNMLKEQLDSTYNAYLKKGTDTGTGQNVGMLTRIDPLVSLYRSEEKVTYPISGTKCGSTTASGTSGVSKHYITEFKFGTMNVAMIGAHLLAIPTDPARCVQREAQAQVIQNVVSSYIQKGYEVILIGDMNDYDAEVLDLNYDKPVSRVLDIMKGLDGEKKGTYTLTNIATKIVQTERYSDWWDSDNNCNTSSQKDLSMIDHILVTSGINKKITNAYIYHGYKEYCGKWDSDHWPVVIDINTI